MILSHLQFEFKKYGNIEATIRVKFSLPIINVLIDAMQPLKRTVT